MIFRQEDCKIIQDFRPEINTSLLNTKHIHRHELVVPPPYRSLSRRGTLVRRAQTCDSNKLTPPISRLIQDIPYNNRFADRICLVRNASRSFNWFGRQAERRKIQHPQFADRCYLQSWWVTRCFPPFSASNRRTRWRNRPGISEPVADTALPRTGNFPYAPAPPPAP